MNARKKIISIVWIFFIIAASLLVFDSPALYSQVIVSLVLILGSAVLMAARQYEKPFGPRLVAVVIGVTALLVAAGLIGFGWIPSEAFPAPVALLAICMAIAGPIAQLMAPNKVLLEQLEQSKEWIKDLKSGAEEFKRKISDLEDRLASAKSDTDNKAEGNKEEQFAQREAELQQKVQKAQQDAETVRADAQRAENMHKQREADLQRQIDSLTRDIEDLLEKPSAETQRTTVEPTAVAAPEVQPAVVTSRNTPESEPTAEVQPVVVASPDTPTDTEIQSALGKDDDVPTTATPPVETVAEVVPLVAPESGINGELLIGVDPNSGEIIAKETAIPQTSVYLNKIEDNDNERVFEVCCSTPIDDILCVGVWLKNNGSRKDEFFRIAPGEVKAKTLFRVPHDVNITFDVIDYLYLNPSRKVMDKLGITKCPPYTTEVYRSAISPVEVYAEI